VRGRVLLTLWCAAVIWWGFARPAYAYIDPATTSYIIQIVSALIISLSVGIGVFFRRIQTGLVTFRPRLSAWWSRRGTAGSRRAARATETTDAAAPILDADLQAAVTAALAGGAGVAVATSATTRAPASALEKLFGDDRTWLRRLPLALLACLGITVPLIATGPLTLFPGNAAELPFNLGILAGTVIPVALGLGIVAGALLAVVRGRVFDVVVSVLVGAGLASWVQSLWLNLPTGGFTGATFDWSAHLGATLADAGIWLVLIAAPVVLRVVNRRAWRAVALLVPGLLIAVGVITASVTISNARLSNGSAVGSYITEAGLTQVSSSNNIIVFLVDATDERVIQELSRAHDFSFSPLMGFTSFNQNVARYQETFPALPYLFTGKDFTGSQTRSEYYSTVFKQSPSLLPAMKKLGYQVNIYTAAEDLYWSPSDVTGLVDNMSDTSAHIDRRALLAGMTRLAAFGRSPLALQPSLWLAPDQFAGVLQANAHLAAPYQIDDAALYQEIVNHPLTVGGDAPRLTFIHLEGSHYPYTLNAQAQRIAATESGELEQAKGTFHIIYTYLDQLRALGLYDSSTILIMADHGTHLGWSDRTLDRPLLPCLFVKPAGAPDVAMRNSDAPTYADNFAPTIIQAAGGDPTPYGLTYFQVPDVTAEPRRFYWIRPAYNGLPGVLEVFDIRGNALDFKNWTLVDTVDMQQDNWHK